MKEQRGQPDPSDRHDVPRDPRLEALLDRALGRFEAEEAMDPGLPGRVVAATAERLSAGPGSVSSAAATWAADGSAVAGRIGGLAGGWKFAVAAAVLLAGVVSWLVVGLDDELPAGEGPTIASRPTAEQSAGLPDGVASTIGSATDRAAADQTAAGVDVAALEAELVRLGDQPLASPSPDVLDDQLDLLAMQLSFAGSDGVWADDAIVSLDKAMARDEFDVLAEQLDLLF